MNDDSDGNEDEFVLEHLLYSEDEMNSISRHKGSVAGRKVVKRDITRGGEQLYSDYFSSTPVHNDEIFRRRFRMQRSLFLRILSTLQQHSGSYFIQTQDAIGRIGLSPFQTMTASLRQLAYGVTADATGIG